MVITYLQYNIYLPIKGPMGAKKKQPKKLGLKGDINKKLGSNGGMWVRVFNATLNNISVISWQSVLLARGNWSTWGKRPNCRKSLANFIT
jgi:hypothetical protein